MKSQKPSQISHLPCKILVTSLFCVTALPSHASTDSHLSQTQQAVSDHVIGEQRQQLEINTQGQGFGPQSPRDIDSIDGSNTVKFALSPEYQKMNLCNIHFHKNAEHAGGEFTEYAGNGDGQGYFTGYRYAKQLSDAEIAPIERAACPDKHGGLHPGDTIEVHYVFSSAQIEPGPTLGACLSPAINNPQLRVEAQVMVLVNDSEALQFNELAHVDKHSGFYQATRLLNNMGDPITYAGSTTGPNYNQKGSPLQVTWSVRPKVAKVDIDSVGTWCEGNIFEENHAHGVRNLVTNPALLSKIN
ncbi:delta-class carbonic anhydrase [Thaumasiovibrio subtropicus]|uniref:delta-class carbonic anhydrase n=1 Tax=Thaumasiovibrio subtropicus TaxID=1891207 RepID=UPI000B360D75|nr:delta-class carbonic anhydrase [Thaumasiovibrio subtropicus]